MNYIKDFLEYLQVIKKYSKNTINSYQKDLEEYISITNNILEIKENEVSKYLEYLYKKDLKRNTISRKLSSIRSFYNYLNKNHIINNNYFKELTNPKKIESLPKYVKYNDLETMFNSFDMTKTLDQRNRLALEMIYATGVRVSELVNIKLKDINKYENTIKILGKGNKERIVIYGSFCSDILDIYLQDGRKKLNKNKSEYLFLNKNGTKLSDRYIRVILDNVIKKCNISYHISPHSLRHTFATDMINAGADLVSVKDLLGHTSLNTTSIYTHISAAQIKKVYEFAHPRAK